MSCTKWFGEFDLENFDAEEKKAGELARNPPACCAIAIGVYIAGIAAIAGVTVIRMTLAAVE